MGMYGIIYACILVPTVILCLLNNKYAVLGFIMGMKWMFFTIPFREFIDTKARHFEMITDQTMTPFDSPYYFATIATVSVLLILKFCSHLQAGLLISVLLILSMLLGYFPQALEYVSLHTTMVVAEIFAYSQILVLWFGVWRSDRLFTERGAARADAVVNFGRRYSVDLVSKDKIFHPVSNTKSFRD